ncbi:hypothetical protein N7454_000604 [Penicillium verhagenii]|nr:hypothetical protein N7454_000604 [Penicillium verhagenii]
MGYDPPAPAGLGRNQPSPPGNWGPRPSVEISRLAQATGPPGSPARPGVAPAPSGPLRAQGRPPINWLPAVVARPRAGAREQGRPPLQAPGAAGSLDGGGVKPTNLAKSSAEDLSPREVTLQSASQLPGFLPGSRRQPAEVRGPEAYSYPTTTCGAKSPRSGTDSDLEAFSHNPADGSVAALPGQTAAKTNYLNQRFLSY